MDDYTEQRLNATTPPNADTPAATNGGLVSELALAWAEARRTRSDDLTKRIEQQIESFRGRDADLDRVIDIWAQDRRRLDEVGDRVHAVVQETPRAIEKPSARVESQVVLDEYVRTMAAAAGHPADEIAKAKQLLDAGAINREEYNALKSRALA